MTPTRDERARRPPSTDPSPQVLNSLLFSVLLCDEWVILTDHWRKTENENFCGSVKIRALHQCSGSSSTAFQDVVSIVLLWRMKNEKDLKKEPDHRGHLKQEDKENKHVGCLTIWIQITETLAFILTRYVTSKLAHWGEEFNLVTFWHTCKLNFVMRIVEKKHAIANLHANNVRRNHFETV